MSSLTKKSEKTRSQGSVHSSSQFATRAALEDIATSAQHPRILPGSSMTVSPSVAPNSAYARWRLLSRARSTSPGPRRVASPIGISVVQRRAQMVERVAESAMSGVAQVVGQTRRACEVAKAAIVEARSMHGVVDSRVVAISAHADASAAHAIEVLLEHVQKSAVETEAKMSRTVGTVVQ